jgi:hypothetical protein
MTAWLPAETSVGIRPGIMAVTGAGAEEVETPVAIAVAWELIAMVEAIAIEGAAGAAAASPATLAPWPPTPAPPPPDAPFTTAASFVEVHSFAQDALALALVLVVPAGLAAGPFMRISAPATVFAAACATADAPSSEEATRGEDEPCACCVWIFHAWILERTFSPAGPWYTKYAPAGASCRTVRQSGGSVVRLSCPTVRTRAAVERAVMLAAATAAVLRAAAADESGSAGVAAAMAAATLLARLPAAAEDDR